MPKDIHVLIVGAGIAGLGLARALQRSGVVADVVEREPTWGPGGAGIYLPGNAVRALRTLGIDSVVAQRAAAIPRQRFCDHRGHLLADIDLGPLWGDVGACLALHRADLHEIMLSHGDGVSVRMGMPVRRLQEHGETVTVEFGDATTAEYDLVVGADGVHSTVRELMLGPGAVRPLGQRSWRFVTRCPPDVNTWSVFLGRAVTFLAVPIGSGRVYCYCDAPAGSGVGASNGAVAGDLARLLTDFAGPVPALLDSLGSEPAVHVGAIEEVRLDRWRKKSVVLIGDAAHATSPNMAEGAAMALEDALVLSECLAANHGITNALASYEARRRPRTDWVSAQTHRRDRTRRLPPAVRNAMLRAFGRRIFYHSYRPLLQAP